MQIVRTATATAPSTSQAQRDWYARFQIAAALAAAGR